MVTFPFELKPRVWYYRSDIFEEAGIDVSQIKTTDDFIEAGKAIQKIYQINISGIWDPMFLLIAII